jgi:hypothetical protein
MCQISDRKAAPLLAGSRLSPAPRGNRGDVVLQVQPRVMFDRWANVEYYDVYPANSISDEEVVRDTSWAYRYGYENRCCQPHPQCIVIWLLIVVCCVIPVGIIVTGVIMCAEMNGANTTGATWTPAGVDGSGNGTGFMLC